MKLILFRRSGALLLPTVLYYFLSLYPLMADAKKESQLRLLSHHAVKQFNPESVTVQKRVTMNRLYM